MTIQEIRDRLKDRCVGIAGCGGLGSNCAMALARTGIGKLVLVDHDRVEESNLNRQYFFRNQLGEYKVDALKENIHAVDEHVDIETYRNTLDPSSVKKLFATCDIIVEAFDTDHAKQMIIETVVAEMPARWIISGQGLAGYGNNESIITRKLDKLYIIGDGKSAVSDEHPPLGPRVGVVSNMQANLVLELLLEDME